MILDIHIETDGNQNNAAAAYILTEIAKVLNRQCHGKHKVTHTVDHRTHLVEDTTDRRENRYSWYEPSNDSYWTCDAYDHGPFCRQCRRVR